MGKSNDIDWLEYYRRRPCQVCGEPPPSDPAHIQSKGSGGPDSEDNLMSLCRGHHVQNHAYGWKAFSKMYGLPISFENIYPRRSDIKNNEGEDK